ncbi:C39 family peptidase [Mesobacterium pallidum]|uniref:C39 family peptidase n=1 Tax=Mesobacterium pallidum TaxID=2872037 RepID=UPI001EE2695C|nr:C39 family peptidase [Mesobacterium pallidum]
MLATAAVCACPAPALAELRPSEGRVPTRSLPAPIVSRSLVRLDVPHIRQGRNLCVPTSVAMVLAYQGRPRDPKALKTLAEGHKPAGQRNKDFTYWADMQTGLRQIGERWSIRHVDKSSAGLRQGLAEMHRLLRRNVPVIIEVELGPGHSFVVMGFDDSRQEIFVRDPDIPSRDSRRLSYAELNESWHNHAYGPGRSLFHPAG